MVEADGAADDEQIPEPPRPHNSNQEASAPGTDRVPIAPDASLPSVQQTSRTLSGADDRQGFQNPTDGDAPNTPPSRRDSDSQEPSQHDSDGACVDGTRRLADVIADLSRQIDPSDTFRHSPLVVEGTGDVRLCELYAALSLAGKSFFAKQTDVTDYVRQHPVRFGVGQGGEPYRALASPHTLIICYARRLVVVNDPWFQPTPVTPDN